MNKLYALIMCVGIAMAGYFGYEWWQGTQGVEEVSAEETKKWGSEKASEVTPEESVKIQEVLMSDQIKQFDVGQEIGRLVIPTIEKGFTTYWGTDDDTLSQGVGMYVSQFTTTPDQKRHTVLSGHRDTVFTGLQDVKKGDAVFFEYEGKRYEYAVVSMKVVDADDRTVIVDKKEATLTLTTCYPFDFIGSAPERYVIQSEFVHVSDM
ncbi:class D sortase [Bacillus hwajinpoensis]|uniref:Class D sortase n=1 Tax=Guptibacillus hwajinpoensis TaxID=208199 RepID=A0A845EUL5_9BACL|nr:class D sortase [Pseudalkalibacillus hwajinpoensis]MYL62526.1 class D sortase [Pseudalkalibacillus hwajinpoensis]